jgi:hypothetical protein
MRGLFRLVVLTLSLVTISACATVAGGLIGAGAGAVVDIVDD